MASVQTVVFCIALAFVGTALQGCGCDEEEAKKCLEDKTKELTTMVSSGDVDNAKLCDLVKGMFACITEKDCCEKDELKTSLDSSKKSFETYLKDCDLKGCE